MWETGMARLSLSAGFAVFASLACAQAGELSDGIKQAGALHLTVNATYAPMEYRDPASNELVGLDIDLASELAKRLGVKIVWSETAFEIDANFKRHEAEETKRQEM
jgi:polar amino acid transport system substrate-binding protein